jgi:hypothetical protein
MKINDQIRLRFPNERTKDIADDLGLTYSQVANRAFTMGLRKSEEFKKSDKSGRHNLIEGGKKSRFKNGHKPHNKGKKMTPYVYEKVKHSMWKPGHKPHNWKPDGSIVERTDKTGRNYLYYKIKDSYWVLYHNKIWMDHNGPIPAKHIIAFKDGNTLNCDINNLELLSMANNALRNSIQRFPKDLQQVIKLKAKLTKKIKQNGKK